MGGSTPLALRIVLDHPEDVVGIEDQVILVVEPDLGPRVLGEDDDVALVNLDPVLELPDRDDLRHLRLLLGRIRQDDARCRRLLTLDRFYQSPFAEWSELHPATPPYLISSSDFTRPPARPQNLGPPELT